MPLIDQAEDRLVVRIVYAGAPGAGKRETLRQLMQLLGGEVPVGLRVDALDPASTFERSRHEAGVFMGQPIRAVVTTTPGSPRLSRCRQLLIESADAVVFVTGSQPKEVLEAVSYFDELQPWLARADLGYPVPLIVQINQRDESWVMPAADIRRAMGLADETQTYESIVETGLRLQVPYIRATRHCIARARLLQAEGKLARLADPLGSEAQLLATLRTGVRAKSNRQPKVETPFSRQSERVPPLPAEAPPPSSLPTSVPRPAKESFEDVRVGERPLVAKKANPPLMSPALESLPPWEPVWQTNLAASSDGAVKPTFERTVERKVEPRAEPNGRVPSGIERTPRLRVIEGASPERLPETHPTGPPARLIVPVPTEGTQVESNLSHPQYLTLLARALSVNANINEAGIVNVDAAEACVGFSSGRRASDEELKVALSLCRGLLPASPGPMEDPDLYRTIFDLMTPVDLAHFAVGEERVFIRRQKRTRHILVVVTSARLSLGSSLMILGDLDDIDSVLEPEAQERLERLPDVLAIVVIESKGGTVLRRHERYDGATTVELGDPLVEVARQFFFVDSDPKPVRFRSRANEPLVTHDLFIDDGRHGYYLSRLSFARDHVLYFVADRQVPQGLNWYALNRVKNDTMRLWVAELLGQGLETEVEPFPHTEREFYEIVEQLRTLAPDDLIGRLKIGGFLNHEVTVGDDLQRCKECIYYLPNAKWCDLPELPIPVEAEWWCRLWKL